MTPANGVPTALPQKKKKLKGCALVGAIGVLALALAAAAFAAFAEANTEDEPVLVTGLDIASVQPPGFYTLSAEQQTVLSQKGYPDSFLILFYDETQPNSQRASLREETWYYHETGLEITYHNGVKLTESLQTFEPDSLFSTPYRPEMFIRQMTMEEVLAVTQQATYLENPIEEALLPDADLYFAQGLAFGLADGRLRYLETIPLSAQ